MISRLVASLSPFWYTRELSLSFLFCMPFLKKTSTVSSPAPQADTICRLPLTAEERAHMMQPNPPRFSDITWRIFRIMAEFVEGFQFLSGSSREVTIFGSTRLPASNPWYKQAEHLGHLLGKAGFTVVTGGGPGIMEAANKGATEAGGDSLGINIQLNSEQRMNPYVKRGRGFHYFFTRKVILMASAQAYVFFPGGFGTLDEFFEIVTLIQTEKAQRLPIVCVGKAFWEPLQDWIASTVRGEYSAVSEEDMHIFQIVDSAEEAFDLVKYSEERNFF